MNRELKTKWLEALRSGKYKQGRMALRTIQDEFCCLGVLCDIVAPDAWSKRLPNSDHYIHMNNGGGIPSFNLYPEYAPDFAPNKHGQGRLGVLVNMNDSGKTFAEIADYIEENL